MTNPDTTNMETDAQDIGQPQGQDEAGAPVNIHMAKINRRTKRIHLLRVAIPVVIIGLLALNASWITIQSVINALNTPKTKSDEIRMVNPRFQGQTDSAERYVISGLEALRKTSNAKKISLKAPVIDLKGKSDNPVQLKADNGVFDEEKNLFFMNGHVLIKGGGSDFTFTTDAAIVDLNKSEIYGDKHVEAKGSMGHIVGESFKISDNGNMIDIRGRGDTKVKANLSQ